jgi:hypothetical protein
MLSRLELIPRSTFPAFLTGSVAEEASIAAQQSCERGVRHRTLVRSFYEETQPPAGFVIVVLLRKTWQISKTFPAITRLSV